MTPGRCKSPSSQFSSQELHPTTDDLEAIEDATPTIGALSDPDATTWHEPLEHELTAPVQLPSKEAMTVRLGPINLIERLDEYHSDETLAHTLVGLFFGAILGIISDLFSKSPFEISPFSIILIVILLILSVSAIVWLMRIRKRRMKVQEQLRVEK